MSSGDRDRERNEILRRNASSALAVIDRMISGDPGAVLSADNLRWIRGLLLDEIDFSEAALGLEQTQTPEDRQRAAALALDDGILAAYEEQPQPARHLPVAESRTAPGMHWLLHVPCPECGAPGVAQTGPGAYGRDHEAVTVHPDRDKYDSPIGTCGGYTQIDLRCALGHRFALIIANHKSDEYIGTVTASRAAGQDS
jgi:hypothetical protein